MWHKDELSMGLLELQSNLINKGIVPKDVDILPAFERGVPPFYNKQAK